MTKLEYPLSVTGVIKKVFPNKRDPYGFMRLLTPRELRGAEAAFFYDDVRIPIEEKKYLQPGMMMNFEIIEKPQDHMLSRVPFKAQKISPIEFSHYKGMIIFAPTLQDADRECLATLDMTLTRVRISRNSYRALNKQAFKGDQCEIRLSWNNIIEAASMGDGIPKGDIVSIDRIIPPNSVRGRSLSFSSTAAEVTMNNSDVPTEIESTTDEKQSDGGCIQETGTESRKSEDDAEDESDSEVSYSSSEEENRMRSYSELQESYNSQCGLLMQQCPCLRNCPDCSLICGRSSSPSPRFPPAVGGGLFSSFPLPFPSNSICHHGIHLSFRWPVQRRYAEWFE